MGNNAPVRAGNTRDLLLNFSVDQTVQKLEEIAIGYEGGYVNRYGSVSPASTWPVTGVYTRPGS